MKWYLSLPNNTLQFPIIFSETGRGVTNLFSKLHGEIFSFCVSRFLHTRSFVIFNLDDFKLIFINFFFFFSAMDFREFQESWLATRTTLKYIPCGFKSVIGILVVFNESLCWGMKWMCEAGVENDLFVRLNLRFLVY